MAIKNLEKDVVARIVTQLKGIDGTTNYNNTIAAADVHSEFLLITETHNFPTICIGGITQGESIMFVRDGFELPIEVEIFGYIKDEDTPITEALELLSDMRIALMADEELNDKITGMTLSSEVGAMDGYGVVSLKVSGVLEHYSY